MMWQIVSVFLYKRPLIHKLFRSSCSHKLDNFFINFTKQQSFILTCQVYFKSFSILNEIAGYFPFNLPSSDSCSDSACPTFVLSSNGVAMQAVSRYCCYSCVMSRQNRERQSLMIKIKEIGVRIHQALTSLIMVRFAQFKRQNPLIEGLPTTWATQFLARIMGNGLFLSYFW